MTEYTYTRMTDDDISAKVKRIINCPNAVATGDARIRIIVDVGDVKLTDEQKIKLRDFFKTLDMVQK